MMTEVAPPIELDDPPQAQARHARRMDPRTVLDWTSEYAILVSVVALFVWLSFASDSFLTKTNLLNILDQQAGLGIVACGVTLAVIGGGFDLSVGAVYAMSAILAAKVGVHSPTLGLITGVAVGLGFGIVNGLVVTFGRIQSFVATLAASIIVRGLALVITGGFIVTVSDDSFGKVGNGEILGVHTPIWFLMGFFLATWFLLSRTTLGRYIYAVGGNAEAARLSGVRVNAIRFITFAISGLGAGLAGMIDVSRVGSGQAGIGAGLELTALAAVAVGGSSIAGGEGAIWRTFLGVMLLALINNGFDLLGVQPTYQQVMQGSLIIAAIALDAWTRRRH
jgi:ribose transport system permease protein